VIESAVLGLFVVLAVAGAVAVATVRHVLQSIIALGVCLFGLAGIFLYLGSPFVAAMQVLIYIGGISVAMVFAMMLSVSMARKVPLDGKKLLLAGVVALLFFVGVAPVIANASFPEAAALPADAWSVEKIGKAFVGPFNVVFEMLSLVLLVAIIGAILVAKKDPAPR
jgi:NADH-quinone oxidoreductase subunit J